MKLVKLKGKMAAYKEFQLDIFCDRFIDVNRWVRLRRFLWWKEIDKYRKFKYFRYFLKFERIMQLLYDAYAERKNPPRRRGRFRYRIDIIERPKIRKFRNLAGLSYKRVRVYYRYLSLAHFKKFDKQARSKSGYIVSHLIMLLEFRMCVFLYKMSFIRNMYDASAFLRHKPLIIENRIPTNINSRVWLFEFIQFRTKNIKNKIKFQLMQKLVSGLLYFPIPRYMYSNWRLMIWMIIKRPQLKDVPYWTTQLDQIRRYIPTKDPARVYNVYGTAKGGYRMGYQPNIGVDIRRVIEREGKDRRDFKKAINKIAR